jgi:hypothetical protein
VLGLVLSQLLGGPEPIVSRAELRLAQIYRAAEWTRRVPIELATAYIVRSKVREYLEELELPEELRARLQARIDAPDFVDELVPFLIAVKDMYAPDQAEGPETFDQHLRASFAPDEAIPGMQHSMFAWQPEAGGGGGLPALDRELAVQLVSFYDALYLRGESEREGLGEGLACASRTLEHGLREAAAAAQPPVRELLEGLSESLEEGGDLEAGLQQVLDDPVKLEAATASVIQFIDQLVCKHYRIFATRLLRERQLAEWLAGELDQPGGGALWAYLSHVARERRYGVLVVVDGLEGGLVRALAAGRAESPFLRQLVAARERARASPPASPRRRSPPATRNDFLAQLAREGFRHPHYLPFFRGLFAFERAHLARVGISTSPTISVRNLPVAKTGAPVAGPGGTGIPNFHFVDRGEQSGRAWYFYGNDAVQLGALTRAAGMRSLFERLPHLSSMSCAAQYDEAAHYSVDAFLNLGLGEKLRDFGERLCLHELAQRARSRSRALELIGALEARRDLLTTRFRWFELYRRWGQRGELGLARMRLAELARLEQESLPELLVYYNPWPDHFAHFKGPFGDEIIAPSGELNRLDYWLGRFASVYRDEGVAGRTVFGLAGDHGLAPVYHLLNPEVEVFDALREEGHDFRLVKISSDEGEGPKLTNPFEPPSLRDIDVVVASTAGGNYMLDLFADQDERWSEQPTYSDLLAVRPLAAERDAPPLDLVWELTSRLADSLDYLAVRETPCDAQGGVVRLVSMRDGRRSDAWVRREGERLYYRYDGVDLLDTGRLTPYEALGPQAHALHARLRERCVVAADPERPESWCDERSWRELTSYTPRPDSVVQIGHLYDTPRAGTVNLFPAEGVGYNSIVPGRHAGEHFHEKNAFAGVWGEPLATRDPARPLRSLVIGSVPMAIYEHLTGEHLVRGRDGWGYDSLANAVRAAPRSGSGRARPERGPGRR